MFEWRDHRRWLEGWENAPVAETEIVETDHLGLFQRDSIGSIHGGPTRRQTRRIRSARPRARELAGMCGDFVENE
jgi:hypothetical protein